MPKLLDEPNKTDITMTKMVYSVFLAYSLVSTKCGLRTHYPTFLNPFTSFVKLPVI